MRLGINDIFIKSLLKNKTKQNKTKQKKDFKTSADTTLT